MRPKASQLISKLCIAMFDVKLLFKSPTPFCSFHCSTILSLWLFLSLKAVFLKLSYSADISKFWSLQGNFNITASFSSIWDPHMNICAPPNRLGLFSNPCFYSTPGSGQLYCYCFSSHGTDIFNMLGSPAATRLHCLPLKHFLCCATP